MKFIIGVTGEKGSGKETFTNFLKAKLSQNISHVKFSDILFETLNGWDIPATRENLQNLAIVINTYFGENALSHATSKKIEQVDAEIVILDGIRWETDLKLLRKFDNNILVYITADLHIRYKRSKLRAEKVNEKDATFKKFVEQEKTKTEILIPKIRSTADYTIKNNGTLGEFEKKVENFIQNFLAKDLKGNV